MATYTTYDQVGIKEDVSDVISTLTPTAVPFQTSIKSEGIKNRRHDWQEDSLRAVTDNKKVEGFTASDATLTATTLRSNYTQIMEKTIKVSETADAIDAYGRAKESAYQLVKAGKELKRDLEHAMVGLDRNYSAGNSTSARNMATALYMTSNEVVTDANGATTGVTAGPLTEANVLEAHETLYNEGGDASILMVKPADAILVADFAKASGRYREIPNGAGDRSVINAVELYVSPFGELKVVINRFLKTDHALMYDPANFKRLTLRDWTRTPLAKQGDNQMTMIVGEYSLKHVNFKASAIISNLT